MSKVLLAGSNHIIVPNSPRDSKHEILLYRDNRRLYITERLLQKMWRPLEGLILLELLSAQCDLIHAFNAIPYTKKPWMVTFESILPRTIGKYGNKLGAKVIDRLALDNCRKIVAISNYAKEKFLKLNANWIGIKSIKNKLTVISPNFPIRVSNPKKYLRGETIELTFVGNDFARKGGVVALRIAEKALKMKLPIKINIISRMNYGAKVYTDCLDNSNYQKDLALLSLKNVSLYKSIPNQEVIKLLMRSHFQSMCTLDDTYGFSILEGFSVGTPAITTNVCALPEFVNKSNGLVIDLELNGYKNWINLEKRKEKFYWSILDQTYDELANRALKFITQIIDNPEDYEQLSEGSLAQANIHDSQKANDVLDNLYLELSQ